MHFLSNSLLCAVLLGSAVLVICQKSYSLQDKVHVLVNKVSPYYNPHLSYFYYTIPVCTPKDIQFKALGLGDAFNGDRLAYSMYDVTFNVNYEKKTLCTTYLDPSMLKDLREAIEANYVFEFIVDDIPLTGFLGYVDEDAGHLVQNMIAKGGHHHDILLFSHHHFEFTTSKDGKHILFANVTVSDPIKLPEPGNSETMSITYIYSVHWKTSEHAIADRPQYIERMQSESGSIIQQPYSVHWVSILNSFFIVAFVAAIGIGVLTQMLREDLKTYNTPMEGIEDDENALMSDYGWKVIGSDVFRPPSYPSLFAAVLGVGSQFVVTTCAVVLLLLNELLDFQHHGSVLANSFIIYMLSSLVGGYVSGSWYKKFCGVMNAGPIAVNRQASWISNANHAFLLFVAPGALIFIIVNTTAWAYGTTQAIPVSIFLMLLALVLFVGYPLTAVGAAVAKNVAAPLDPPVRPRIVPRELPPAAARRHLYLLCFVGIVVFGSVALEFRYMLRAIWLHQRDSSHFHGLIAVFFFSLFFATITTSPLATYFLLSREDYRWWWSSLANAAAVGPLLLLYSTVFYFSSSGMVGFMSFVSFFGTTVLACYAVSLMLSTLGFFASHQFVRYIYFNLRTD